MLLKKPPRWLQYVSLTFFGFFLAFLVGEIAVRLLKQDRSRTPTKSGVVSAEEFTRFMQGYSQRNSDFVFYGQLGAKKEFEIHGRTNSLGFYEKEYPFHKDANVFRIVVIGDSFVEGLQLPLEKHFPKILEKALNEKYPDRKFEVIALGRSGNGPVANFQFLRDPGIKFSPDIVISEFLAGNDIRNDSPALTVLYRRQIEELRNISLSYRPRVFQPEFPVLRSSRLFQLLGQSILNLEFKFRRMQLPPAEQVPVDYFVYAADYNAQWQRAWNGTLAATRDANALCQSHQSAFVLANFGEPSKITKSEFELFLKSNPAMKHYKWDFDHPDKMIRSFCVKENIKLLELEREFQDEYARTNQPLYFEYDGHWNEAGHRLAAQKILEYLEKERLLKK